MGETVCQSVGLAPLQTGHRPVAGQRVHSDTGLTSVLFLGGVASSSAEGGSPFSCSGLLYRSGFLVQLCQNRLSFRS